MVQYVDFRPHPLLRTGHLQTLWIGLDRGGVPPYQASTRLIPLRDGERIVVHEDAQPELVESAPLVVLLHGLGGAHCSPYLARLSARLRQRGVRVWRVDLRGCGAGMELAWKPANAGSSADLAAVLAAAASRFPSAPLAVIGFSLSGNILLKLLGELGAGALPYPDVHSAINAALAVAPPVDLHACAANMDRFSRAIYSRYYIRLLMHQVGQRRNRWPQWAALPYRPFPKTIRQFDQRYTAPLSGYRSAEEYYTDASAAPWVRHIVIPTDVLVDRQDPIIDPVTTIEAPFSPAVRVLVTQRGGHMAYFARREGGGIQRWMEDWVVQWVGKRVPEGMGTHLRPPRQVVSPVDRAISCD
ncbi:MAG: hydrolase [Pirellulaceae bacterium]|nr:MAG: hydrolase [Pirellulaceae bacterium]